jgi:hypothetical protein
MLVGSESVASTSFGVFSKVIRGETRGNTKKTTVLW